MKTYFLLILSALILIVLVLDETALSNENSDNNHEQNSSLSLFSLVQPLGIATLCFVSATFLTGLFRSKLRRRFLKIHLLLAIISVILGFSHGVLVLVLFG